MKRCKHCGMYRNQCLQCTIDETPKPDKHGWWRMQHKKPPTFKYLEVCNERGSVSVGEFDDEYVFTDTYFITPVEDEFYPTHWREIQKPEVYENT